MAAEILLSDPTLTDHAREIRALGKRVVGDVIEIGRRLTEGKIICGHGGFRPWLHREFGWTDKMAERFMSIYALSGKFDNLSNLALPLSGLYLLAAPSTPDEARAEVIERVQAGETLQVAEIKDAIEATKKMAVPQRKPGACPALPAAAPTERGVAMRDASVLWTHLREALEHLGALPRPHDTAQHVRKLARVPRIIDQRLLGALQWMEEFLQEWKSRDDQQQQQKSGAGAKDIGLDSAGEIERLRARNEELETTVRRLTRENIVVRSEIEEAKITKFEDFFEGIERTEFLAAIPTRWDLEGRMLRACSIAKLLAELERRLPSELWKKHQSAVKAIRGALNPSEQHAGLAELCAPLFRSGKSSP
jgi:hypothetical protein